MSHQTWEPTYSLPAAADLSANQFQAVVINSSGLIALAGVGVLPEAVLQNLPVSGAMARIFTLQRYVGKIKVGVGGISAGAKFACDATGRAIVGATGNKYFGIALETGVVNQFVTAWFDFSGRYGAVP